MVNNCHIGHSKPLGTRLQSIKKAKKCCENQPLGIGQNQVSSPLTSKVKVTSCKGNQNPNMLRQLLKEDGLIICFFVLPGQDHLEANQPTPTLGEDNGNHRCITIHHRIIYFLL